VELAPPSDPCAPIPTCIDCVKQQFCGWCSAPITYEDGTRGKRCAYQGANAKPFVCDGTYQTETCIPEEYKCDNKSFTCKIAPFNSGGSTIEKCLAGCFPPTYFCDKPRKQCIKADPGNGTSFEICNATCIHDQKQYTCDPKTLTCIPDDKGEPMAVCQSTCGQAQNVTPDSNIVGKWRGVQINHGYKVGEWKMDITTSSQVTITQPDKSIWVKGTLQTSSNELWIRDEKGVRRSIFGINVLPTTRAMTWAIGSVGNPPPVDFNTAMREKGSGTVFVFWKCLSEGNCDFANLHHLIDQILASAKRDSGIKDSIDDACAKNPTCEICIADKGNRCGWCSTNVIYRNGSIPGKQCAGHNGDGSKDPFICNGLYSTETCAPFHTSSSTTTTSDASASASAADASSSTTATTQSSSTTSGKMDKWACDSKNVTCTKSSTGFDFKVDCDQQCTFNPFVPVELLGTWRGIQINKGYIVGEWKVVFTADGCTVSRPDGDKFTAKVGIVSQYLVLEPTSGPLSGKKLQTLWQVLFGVETRLLTWAWGAPSGSAPKDFNSAMVTHDESEYALTACLPNAEKEVCNFDH
jgi:hypothetical protein